MAERDEAAAPKRPARIDWRYTETRRRTFLRVLAETYDPELACEAGNLSWPQVCELRVRHPDFAAQFDEVIAAGYDRLEAMLLRQAGVGKGAAIDPVLAQALIKQRRMGKPEAAAGAKTAAGRQNREQLIRSIMEKVVPLKAAQSRGSGLDAGEGRAGRIGAAAERAG
jgi:hypothetical protein